MYNIVDLIADVSGMVDLLIVFSGFLMSTFFTKQLVKAALINYIGVQLEEEDFSESDRPLATRSKKDENLVL